MSDPGLQHERTSLAWRRSALAAVALAALLARVGAVQANPWDLVAAGWALAAAAAMGAVGRHSRARRAERRLVLVRTTAVSVSAACACAVGAVATTTV